MEEIVFSLNVKIAWMTNETTFPRGVRIMDNDIFLNVMEHRTHVVGLGANHHQLSYRACGCLLGKFQFNYAEHIPL